MLLGYSLPPQLDEEINLLEEMINKFKKGEVSALELKAHRVPFGVYEQRQADTYMVRIRCAAGEVTPLQLEQIARLASGYGVRDLHITSRQELQIHYVSLDDIVPIIRQLRKFGLSTRGGGGNTVRNITAQEDAGIDPDEEFDVSPYASTLTTRLIAESDSWNLPRKYKIAFSGSRQDKGYATISDLGFIARIENGKRGFRVYAAGGLGAKSAEAKLLLDFIEAQDAYAAAKAVKNVFYKFGNRKNKHAARIRFLWDSLGEDEFKRRFHEEYAMIKQDKDALLAVDQTPLPLPVLRLAREKARKPDDFNKWKERSLKVQKQKGLYAIVIPVELGFIPLEQAIELAQFLKPFGTDVLRMTKNQNFLLRNIPEEYLGNVYNFLSRTLPAVERPAIYGNILSCAGASTCQLGFCLSRQAARALMRALEASGLDLDRLQDIKINISGCPNSCGQHPAADLGFSGKALRKQGRLYPAYNVLAGALIRDGETRLAEQVGEVPAKNLPVLLKDLLGLYLSKAKTYPAFGDYIAKEGKEDLRQLSRRYAEIPDFEQDKNYYFDWDADTVFSLADRGSGECSAGLFDLIEVDLKNIRETRHALLTAQEGADEKASLLNGLIFYAVRMLLVTRGIEPKNRQEALEAFLRHFVEQGLIPQSFKELIAVAQTEDRRALLEKENQVYAFVEQAQSLYENMDNSFNFKKPAPAAGAKTEGCAPAAVKDLRGVLCPMNFVQAKVELSRLKPGDILEVWLDDGEPIENVPGSLKAEGHQVVSQKKINGYWSLVIEKKEK